MRTTTGLLGSAVLFAFAAVLACGGNDESGGNGKGGSGGKGSSGSGGKGGASSAGSSSGGKASGSTGGKASGGTGPSIGGTGFGGFGGAFNPEDYACDPVPEQGSACEANTTPCIAGSDVCACAQNKWNCFNVTGTGGTGQIGEIDCPTTKPMNGAACGDSIGICPYGGGANSGCGCYQGKWTCI